MSLPVSEYKIIAGSTKQVDTELAQQGMKGWKPILMSTVVVGDAQKPTVHLTVVLELPAGAGK